MFQFWRDTSDFSGQKVRQVRNEGIRQLRQVVPREGLRFLFSLDEETDEELGVPGRKVELEDRFLDERLDRLAGILPQVAGYPLHGAPDVLSIG